jgi:hypothetical protein
MTPQQAVRQFCVECAGSLSAVHQCGGDKCLNGACGTNGVCWFYPYRLGKGRPSVKLIRRTCLWCMGGSDQFVRECSSSTCSLWAYRMGRNPARAGIGNAISLPLSGRSAA